MKIEDELYLTKKSSVPAGAHVLSKSIGDRDIFELIDALNKIRGIKGIKIDPSNSEQDIEYRVLGSKRQSTVPLKASFEGDVRICGYTLRSRQLELKLKDYHKSSGTSEMIVGGTIDREDGIHCLFEFNGEYKKAKVLDAAKKVLQEFYKKTPSLLNNLKL